MKKYFSIILIALAVAGSGCKKTYLSELALNPDRAGVTTPNLQLAGALGTTANLTSGSSQARYLCWAGYYSWSTNYQPSSPLLLYSITNASYDSFTPLYTNISNYNSIITGTSEPYYVAIAHIMMAYDFQQLVDQYGNVPYFQTLQGLSNLSPVYDDQSAIYDDLMKQLDAAIKLIQTAPATAATPAKFDLMFGASSATGMNNWILFANTLKLRMAIRQSTYTSKAAALKTAVQATAALGYLGTATGGAGTTPTLVEGAVNPGYSNVDPNQPPLDLGYGYKANGVVAGVGAQYQANTFSVNFFVGTGTQATPNDPRLKQVYAPSGTPAANGLIISTKLGETTPPSVGGTQVSPSVFSSFMFNPNRNSPMISAAESLFLQAEATNLGWLTATTAQNLYESGVTASFIEDGLTVTQAATYITTYAAYPAAGAAAQEQAIITQKWAALNPFEPIEAYMELLRTGYPAVPLSIQTGVTATTYVQRMLYPQAEYNTNAANVTLQGTITPYSPKIFWEKP